MYIRNRERGLEKIGWSSSHTRCSTITITLIWIACADAGSKLKKINNKIMCRLCLVIISNETWDRGISWKKEREKVLIETQYINAVLVIHPWNLRQANKEFCLFLKAVEEEREVLNAWRRKLNVKLILIIWASNSLSISAWCTPRTGFLHFTH